MKLKFFALMTVVYALCTVASAQSYAIRVAFYTNLRAGASLQANIVETVPAGTTLTVVGRDNRWLQINHNSDVWMADWVRHERVEETAPTQPQTTTNIDNCCFVDRQCMTDEEWISGYWALQNGQCNAPTQSQIQSSTETTSTVSSQIDNCCFVDRTCNTDQEWTDGYWAFQNGQCSAPVQTQSQASTQPASVDPGQSDNCCFLGWHCRTDLEWANGFHAYRDNQCGMATPAETADSCCQLGWNCTLEENRLVGRWTV